MLAAVQSAATMTLINDFYTALACNLPNGNPPPAASGQPAPPAPAQYGIALLIYAGFLPSRMPGPAEHVSDSVRFGLF
jgi:hypothetical protein